MNLNCLQRPSLLFAFSHFLVSFVVEPKTLHTETKDYQNEVYKVLFCLLHKINSAGCTIIIVDASSFHPSYAAGTEENHFSQYNTFSR